MDLSSSSSSSPERRTPGKHSLPTGYEFLQVLGEGGFGKVIKCRKRSTREVVAMKVSKNTKDLKHEEFMLRTLMRHNLDQQNIIRFHDTVINRREASLVFELLDISLYDYVINLDAPMPLKDVRIVVQQLATAFDALKNIGVIHGDVKLDNIMLVDHVRQPLRVKLIDFGLAIFGSEAKRGRSLQTPCYRAPEIMLGAPFSEAIDIWSLGSVTAIMVYGFMLFPAMLDYDALRLITELLGPAPQRVIEAGLKSKLFYKRDDSGQWVIMTLEEYWRDASNFIDNRFYTFRSLDETISTRQELDNHREPEERRECVDLLKAMLTWDGQQRITPSAILSHPFITSQPRSCDEPGPSSSRSSSVNKRMAKMDRRKDAQKERLQKRTLKNQDHEEQKPDQREPDQRQMDQTVRKEKKRSRLRRFCSWMKRTFCCCCAADEAD